jgi:hypothetical protein
MIPGHIEIKLQEFIAAIFHHGHQVIQVFYGLTIDSKNLPTMSE